MPFLNPSTGTASVAANTNLVTLTGIDLTTVTPGMTISFGSRGRVTGDQFVIQAVALNGTSGGTVTTVDSIATAYTNTPFIIDTTGFLGTDATYQIQTQLALQQTLSTLFGPNTNLYSGSRQLAFDKTTAAALSRLMYSTAGRTWADLSHRTLSYTPTGGAAVSTEALALRAFLDGTTATDAILVDLSTGGADIRKASSTMASAATVDLSSAPTGKVAITGNAAIVSFGSGKHLERLVHFVDGGAVLTHNATSLILPGGANITTRAGDCLHVTSDASGNFRVRSFDAADGTPLIAAGASFRNRLRNASFQINQRGVTGTVTLAAGIYGHDGFKAGAGGCTYTFARSAGVTTITITAGTLIQVIEGVLYLTEGGTYTLSWLGTAQGRVNSGSYAVSPITVTGMSPDANATIEWGTGTLSLPSFETGIKRTPFEYRDDELRRCMRYYQQLGTGGIYQKIAYASAFTSTYVELFATLAPPMRAAPNIIVTGSFIATGAQGNLGFSASNVSVDSSLPQNFALNCNTSGAGTATGAYIIQTGANGSNIVTSAEL